MLDGSIVATGGLKLEGEKTVRVMRLSVAPNARGSGYGTAMLEMLLREARGRGFARAVLETGEDWHSAIAMYERAGFSSVASSYEPETGSHCLEFARDLTGESAVN